MRFSYLVPAVLVAYLVTLPLLPRLDPKAWAPLAIYGGLLIAASSRVALSFRSVSALAIAVPLFLAVHVSYGVGFWRGVTLNGRRRPLPPLDWRAVESESVALAVEAAAE